ncbi:hypothetical protein FIV00_03335 [Labrenzia sp. THAF82]|uniref:hypothetical protein n=1 Tax=Labrenzia sp. THAF82 TaxID=2587861 RepID=UPI00126952EE|nr:hypothetical protein [Labrenzia sp. THAF82]QFT29505.1 hypothetical protein FIV00_03335 [Labrenzia sp. THAF82]
MSIQLPSAKSSQTAFVNKMETFDASTSVIIKGNTTFFNRVAIKLSNPISRLLGTPTRIKVEAKLRNKRRELERGYRDNILDALKNNTWLMKHIHETRKRNSESQDVSVRIEKEKEYIKKTAKKTIENWESNGEPLKQEIRGGFFDLLTDPVIYLGELIDISKKESPIIRRL